MAIEIVDFPIKNGGSFHSYVSLPEGIAVLLKKIWVDGDLLQVHHPWDRTTYHHMLGR